MPITYFTTHDSMATFVPRRQKYALVTITNEYSGRTDSILDALRELDPLRKKGKFTILDLSVDTDTLVWRNTTDPDSVNWTRGWIPGSVSAPAFEKIAPQSLPWFVVTDAKGNMLYNGPSLTRAHAVADSVATLP